MVILINSLKKILYFLKCKRSFKYLKKIKDNSGNIIFFKDEDIYYDYLCNNDLLCSICFVELHEFETFRLKCNHNYHKKCIDKWFKYNNKSLCPTCKLPQ